jgi:hypothetical protein
MRNIKSDRENERDSVFRQSAGAGQIIIFPAAQTRMMIKIIRLKRLDLFILNRLEFCLCGDRI